MNNKQKTNTVQESVLHKASVSGSVIRGQFHFVRNGETIQCWMGEPKMNESEFVFEIHQSFAKDIIAGMVAVTQHCR